LAVKRAPGEEPKEYYRECKLRVGREGFKKKWKEVGD
jgi:hypothetical protein